MTPSKDDRSKELNRLLEKLCEEPLSEEERQQLNQMLRESKDARWQYLAHMDVHAALSCLSGIPSVHIKKDKPKKAVLPSGIFNIFGSTFQKGADFFSRGIVVSLVLAIGLPVIVLLILLIDIAQQPVAIAPKLAPKSVATKTETVAEITKTHRAVWEGGNQELIAGSPLSPQQQLHLAQGLIEITFDDKTKVVLQGPANFQIKNREEGYLKTGRLVADVPKGAEGFTIRTPSAVVVDLGTEFGVQVNDEGTSEAYVFLGQIKVGIATPEETGPQTFQDVHVGQAATVSRHKGKKALKVEKLVSAPDQFIRRLPPETNKALPKPKILFAHRGKKDPRTEKWLLRGAPKAIAEGKIEIRPVDDANTTAWMISDRYPHAGIQYRIEPRNGLDAKRCAEAKKKGWVLRARIKVSGKGAKNKGLCHIAYRDDQRAWVLRPGVALDGNQHVILFGTSSLGPDAVVKIPNSRNRYVNYEIRYQPKTDDADIYIDGRCVATGYRKKRGVESIGLQFGTGERQQGAARFASVEWGPLQQNATKEQSRGK